MNSPKKPNVILFITHDQGQYLRCYDSVQMPNRLNTPNLDKLAREGVKFTNYFCTAPQCSPSRGSIITSLYPHQNGLIGLVNRGWTLPRENKTLAMYMKENGYSTHLLGLQHESFDAHSLGYDTVSKRGAEWKYSCKRMENEFSKFFHQHQHDERPFFLKIGTIEVHLPFRAWTEPVDPKRVKIPPFLPDNAAIRQNFAEFYGAIEVVDNAIGKIMVELEATNLVDNTLFIFTTDHGIPFPRAKCTLYDPGIKTLLLMALPSSEMFSGGKVIHQMISNIDLLPTIMEFTGGRVPNNLEGKSFLPLLNNEISTFREEIFVEKTYHEIYDPMRGIRTKNYKYIWNCEPSDVLYQIPGDIMMEPSGKFMKKLHQKPRPREEFYDLEKDPNEMDNQITDPDYQDIIQELKGKLREWMEKTSDPILQGKIPDKRIKPPKHY
ncbi:MAG: sulfatase family protein [Promethearchaeota archaeon]